MDIIEKLKEKGYIRQAEILESMASDCIEIKTSKSEEGEFAPGGSKIGGVPHLPADFKWDLFSGKPLAFLAQINLEQAAEYDTQGLLPKTGMLYFFHEGGDAVWGFDPKDKGGFRAVYYSGDTSELKAVPLPDDLEDYLKFSPCRLQFSSEKSYPSNLYDFNDVFFGPDESEDNDIFYDIAAEDSGRIIHKLFGYPDLIQNDIFLECQLVSSGLYCGDPGGYNDPRAKELKKGVQDWMLLFQIDSDDNADMMWGDAGRVYFAIKKQDLLSGNYDGVWSVLQCF